MKRRPLIALLIVAVIVAGLIVWFWQTSRHASYQDKSPRDWAAQLYATYEPSGTNAAALAFRAMGPNAVPDLVALLAARDPFYEKVLLQNARRIPAKPRSYLFEKLKPGRTIEYRLGAIRALGVIGPDAHEAVPALARALADSDSRLRWMAAQTIARLGPEAIAALIPLTTNADVNLRHAAVYALGEAREAALPATPALIARTLDANESVRASAFYSLSRIGRPALPITVALAATNTDAEVRGAAFRSLAVLQPGGQFQNSRLVLSTNSPEARKLAIMALWRSRLTNNEAMTLFEISRHDPDPAVVELTEKILQRLNSTNRNRLGPL